jgi:hypothetical protein
MLVDVAFMWMMQMSVVQVVDVVIVHDAGMAALRTMRMIMIIVLGVALAHCQVLIKCYLVKYTDRLLIHALSIMIKSSASALHSRHRHRGTPATTVAAVVYVRQWPAKNCLALLAFSHFALAVIGR